MKEKRNFQRGVFLWLNDKSKRRDMLFFAKFYKKKAPFFHHLERIFKESWREEHKKILLMLYSKKVWGKKEDVKRFVWRTYSGEPETTADDDDVAGKRTTLVVVVKAPPSF